MFPQITPQELEEWSDIILRLDKEYSTALGASPISSEIAGTFKIYDHDGLKVFVSSPDLGDIYGSKISSDHRSHPTPFYSRDLFAGVLWFPAEATDRKLMHLHQSCWTDGTFAPPGGATADTDMFLSPYKNVAPYPADVRVQGYKLDISTIFPSGDCPSYPMVAYDTIRMVIYLICPAMLSDPFLSWRSRMEEELVTIREHLRDVAAKVEEISNQSSSGLSEAVSSNPSTMMYTPPSGSSGSSTGSRRAKELMSDMLRRKTGQISTADGVFHRSELQKDIETILTVMALI